MVNSFILVVFFCLFVSCIGRIYEGLSPQSTQNNSTLTDFCGLEGSIIPKPLTTGQMYALESYITLCSCIQAVLAFTRIFIVGQSD